MHPGEVVRRYRLQRGLTLQEVADKTGCSKSHLSRLESGDSGYMGFGPLPKLLDVMNVVGVPIDEQRKAVGL